MPTPFSPQRAAALGAFVKAAYAMYEADKANPTPAPAEIPAGYDFVAWVTMRDFFINSGPPVFYGLIAQHRSASRDFVLAIRGTSSLLEWWDNFHFGLSNFAPGGRVSAGFLAIYQTLNVLEHSAADGTASDAGLVGLSFADQVQEVVRRRAAPGGVSADSLMLTNVSVTGHSLGAALATLYVVQNTKDGQVQNPALCTFASPRVGDGTFVATFNGLHLTSWRVANVPDIVPQLPFEFLGYRHIDSLQAVDSTGIAQATIACAHSLDTYVHLLDTAQPLDSGCIAVAADAAFDVAPAAVASDALVGLGATPLAPAPTTLPRVTTVEVPGEPGATITINVNINLPHA